MTQEVRDDVMNAVTSFGSQQALRCLALAFKTTAATVNKVHTESYPQNLRPYKNRYTQQGTLQSICISTMIDGHAHDWWTMFELKAFSRKATGGRDDGDMVASVA